MQDDKQYSIIREQGEFMDPVELDEQDNKTVNAADKPAEKSDQ
jgi:hypothetical protein